MDIRSLVSYTEKPAIYSKGTAVMWQDPYISERLLETHLSQATDLASRKESTIINTVEWILEQASGDSLSILDLGCGPGLYAEKFAQKGHDVTGVDFSKNSIRYAKASALNKGLDIRYLECDYLFLDEKNSYDIIIMVFTDYGVLNPQDRKILTEKVFDALKPGGLFIFDVLNENYQAGKDGTTSFEVSSENGFWKKNPYLALYRVFFYEAENVALNQHIVMDEDGCVDLYRFWVHTFSEERLKNELLFSGFAELEYMNNLIPSSEIYRSEDVTFCVARKG